MTVAPGQTLRPYQVRARDELRRLFARRIRRALLVLPTGGGKTTIAAAIVHGAVARGRRVIFIAHRKELIDQASARLSQHGIEHGVIMADHPNWRPWLPVQVASVQTLTARRDSVEIQAPDLVIIDEAHRAKAATYLAQLERWPAALCLGLTATPWRADGKGLGDLFGESVVAATPQELLDEGFLVPARGFGFRAPDLEGVSTSAGDYNVAELAERVTKQVNGDVVKEWLAHARDWTTVAFAVNVATSQALVDEFREGGVAAEHLDGKTPKFEREAILQRLAAGETKVVSNVGVLTEGWDLPAARCCVLVRPTKSVGLFLQMVGRVLRPLPCSCGRTFHPSLAASPCCGEPNRKPFARIHCHAGALAHHGPPEEERDYSLTASVQRRRGESSGPGVTFCPECRCAVAGTADLCPECGFKFLRRDPPKVEKVSGGLVDLEEIRAARIAKLRRETSLEARAAEFRRLLQVADRKGYAKGWASHQYRATFGVWPRFPGLDLDAIPPANAPILPLDELRKLASGAA